MVAFTRMQEVNIEDTNLTSPIWKYVQRINNNEQAVCRVKTGNKLCKKEKPWDRNHPTGDGYLSFPISNIISHLTQVHKLRKVYDENGKLIDLEPTSPAVTSAITAGSVHNNTLSGCQQYYRCPFCFEKRHVNSYNNAHQCQCPDKRKFYDESGFSYSATEIFANPGSATDARTYIKTYVAENRGQSVVCANSPECFVCFFVILWLFIFQVYMLTKRKEKALEALFYVGSTGQALGTRIRQHNNRREGALNSAQAQGLDTLYEYSIKNLARSAAYALEQALIMGKTQCYFRGQSTPYFRSWDRSAP